MNSETAIIDMLTTLLGHLKVNIEKVSVEIDDTTGTRRFIVVTPDSSILIGEHGARLLALNHVAKRMAEKLVQDENYSFIVDVNDYQKKRIDDIRTKAHMLAERARYFKSSVEMDPMSSYERMIVHAEFTNAPDITTESTGQGKDRRVILRFQEKQTV